MARQYIKPRYFTYGKENICLVRYETDAVKMRLHIYFKQANTGKKKTIKNTEKLPCLCQNLDIKRFDGYNIEIVK